MAITPVAFTPANADMLKLSSGAVPVEYGNAILKDVMASSVIMKAGKYEPMTASSKVIDVLTGGPAAYWVDEGERIGTGKPTWKKVTLKAHKLGVILPVSREYLTYKQADFFEIMRPLLAEALYKKFDEEAILGTSGVFDYSIAASLLATGNTVVGDFNLAGYASTVGFLNNAGYEPNAFISKVANASMLRGLIRDSAGMKTQVYDASSKSLDGVPVLDVDNGISGFTNGTLIAGDFDKMRYGIPYNMNYMISQDATLTTIAQSGDQGYAAGGNASVLNLFERDMVALRVTMDVAFMIIDDNAFAQLSGNAIANSVPYKYVVNSTAAAVNVVTAPAAIGDVAIRPDELTVLLAAAIAQNATLKLKSNLTGNPEIVLTAPAATYADASTIKIVFGDVNKAYIQKTGETTWAQIPAGEITGTALTAFKVAAGKTITATPSTATVGMVITG